MVRRLLLDQDEYLHSYCVRTAAKLTALSIGATRADKAGVPKNAIYLLKSVNNDSGSEAGWTVIGLDIKGGVWNSTIRHGGFWMVQGYAANMHDIMRVNKLWEIARRKLTATST